MNKAKNNALDALRALIAERQQYEQWISALESKRDGTPAHVFEKVNEDYESRLDKVIGEISEHAEELQLSITTLSSRLIEVARDEDTRRDTLQEAELRAAVGEYEPSRWEQIRVESQRDLDRIAGDRERLDSELAELRSIQTLSAVGVRPERPPAAPVPLRTDQALRDASPQREQPREQAREQAKAEPLEQPRAQPPAAAAPDAPLVPSAERTSSANDSGRDSAERTSVADSGTRSGEPVGEPRMAGSDSAKSLESARSAEAPVAASAANADGGARTARSLKTPPAGGQATRGTKPADARVEQSKTLKCPECGTPNHPTEWYCERCGGELATM